MNKLTAKQFKVLNVIRNYIAHNAKAPTVRELQTLMKNKGFDAESLRTVSQYLDYLENKGYISRSGEDRGISLLETASNNLAQIPIIGTANAGQPVIIAEEEYQGYLPVSKKLLKNCKDLYAVKISGKSMNREQVSGGTLDNNDYAIIDSSKAIPEINSPFLFIVDGCGVIKKLKQCSDYSALVSNSTEDYKPIYLSRDQDSEVYTLGKVVRVFKNI